MLIDLMIIYTCMTLVFLLLAYTIIRRERSYLNVTLAASAFLIAVNTSVAIIVAYFDIGTTFPLMILRVTAGLPLIYAPVGFVYCGLFVIYGKSVLKETTLRILTILYFLIGILIVIVSIVYFYPTNQIHLFSVSMFSIIIIPISIALYLFIKIYQIVPENKKEILLTIIGFASAIIAQIIRSISYLFNYTDSLLGQILLITGTLVAIFAFIKSGQKEKEMIA